MHKEISRLNSNQQLMQQSQEQILLTNGRIAAQTGVLQLKQQELVRLFPDLNKELKLLGVKPRSAQTVATVSFRAQRQIVATLRDSILPVLKDTAYIGFIQSSAGSHYGETIADSLRFRVFRYQDNYYDVSGYSFMDKQVLHISTRDTMTQVIYRRRKHPWLWIFSRKELMQRVYFKNPDAHIYYSRTIQLQR